MKFTAALALFAVAQATEAEFGLDAFFGDDDDLSSLIPKQDKDEELRYAPRLAHAAAPVQGLISSHVAARYGRPLPSRKAIAKREQVVDLDARAFQPGFGYGRVSLRAEKPVEVKAVEKVEQPVEKIEVREPVKRVVRFSKEQKPVERVRYVAQPVERIAYRRPAPVAYKPAAAPASYGGASYYQGDSLYYEGDSQPTWGYRKGSGMGIYDMPRRTKALIANDGYRVKRRTNVGERTYESINAKCILMDPDYESDVYGTIRLTQLGRAKGTTIWADIQGLDAYAQYDLSINALGDLTDGCDSAGGVFNPFVSKSGYGHWKEPETAPGALGEIKIGQYGAEVDIKADVDLSGTHSIIGRSMVISSQGSEDSYGKKVEGRRVGCCTIGLAAGKKRVAPKQVAYKRVSYDGPAYEAPYQPRGYGYGSGAW